jgi:hypothetical protein
LTVLEHEVSRVARLPPVGRAVLRALLVLRVERSEILRLIEESEHVPLVEAIVDIVVLLDIFILGDRLCADDA